MQLYLNSRIFAHSIKIMSEEKEFENSLLPYLGRTAKFMSFYFIDSFKEFGFSLSKEQWLVLKKLNDKDGQIQNDLAFITNRSKTSLTRLINTMEKKGLVYRMVSKTDKRVNHIYLSELGKLNYLKSQPILKKIKSDLLEDINKKDIEITKKVLDQVLNNINKKTKLYK